MKKFRLELDDLVIDSFTTTPVRKKEKGTVFGEQCTCPTACTCPGCPTCDASCGGTCDASCNDTCGDTCGCPVESDGCTGFTWCTYQETYGTYVDDRGGCVLC